LLARCSPSSPRNNAVSTARVLQGLAYTKTAGDEVEDLMQLLAAAKRRFPGLQGVSSGAIASDYQRLRVESVC